MLKHRLLMLLLILLCILLPVVALPASAGPRVERCFAETGHCISGAIRTYWENNGGLAVFGYPITSEATEMVEGTWSGPVQWFERDRLENHSNENKGVLAGRLGARYLELDSRAWSPYPGDYLSDPNCQIFPQTHYEICGPFRTYWQQNGGLERFGYPITAPSVERIEDQAYTVQYFERRRMEYHPENAGTPYEVLLGLLGNMVHWQEFELDCPMTAPSVLQLTAHTYRTMIGCPSAGVRANVPTSWQPFENGMMLWVQNADGSSGTIYVMYYSNSASYWRSFTDTYIEGELVNADVVPPAGLYVPLRGFGKLWRDDLWVQKNLGYATLPEVADVGLVQPFDDGYAQMIYREGRNMVLIMFRTEQYGIAKAIEMPPMK
ncbi:MAG: hypothetical protein HGA19_24080 [Oscillochloris sp.]|nr:hypothetical protein [Oscillochloris sp.]